MIKKVALAFLVITTLMLLYKGIVVAVATTGTFWGSELSLLITLSNQFAYFMIWLSAAVAYKLADTFSG